MKRTMRERTLMADWPKYCSEPTGYVAWHEWAEAQMLHGLVQKKCPKCPIYMFPQEVQNHVCKPGKSVGKRRATSGEGKQ